MDKLEFVAQDVQHGFRAKQLQEPQEVMLLRKAFIGVINKVTHSIGV